MIYYNGDGTEMTTIYVPANNSIYQQWPLLLPTKDIEDTPENFEYVNKFIGWAFSENGKVENITETNLGRASKDRKFYPIFEKASVYDNILYDEDLIRQGKYYYTIKSGIPLIAGRSNQVILTFNENANQLKGKITLPRAGIDQYGKLVEITAISSVSGLQPNITYIFQENQSIVSLIGDYTFQQWPSLRYVELPQYNTYLGIQAFSGIPNLFRDIEINAFNNFFRKVSEIDYACFWSSGEYFLEGSSFFTLLNKEINLTNIKKIGDAAFSLIFGPNPSRDGDTCTIIIGSRDNPDVDYSQWPIWLYRDSNNNNRIGICDNSSNGTNPIKVTYYAKNNPKEDTQIMSEIQSLCDLDHPGLINVNIVRV